MGTPSAEGSRIEAPRGAGCGEGCPPPHRGGGCAPSPENFLIPLNMVSFGAFWMVFLQFSYLFYTQNQSSTAIGV